MPALLPITDPHDERNTVRIIEDTLGGFEIDAMLFPVTPIPSLNPLKLNHVYLRYRKYMANCQETVSS